MEGGDSSNDYASHVHFILRIWHHLLELVSTQQTTIIVTTHYIEEARKAHTVSLSQLYLFHVDDMHIVMYILCVTVGKCCFPYFL